MAVTNNDLIAYLHPADESEDLSKYLAAACSKARSAGIPDFKHNAQYDMFLLALAAMFYDNRGMAANGGTDIPDMQKMIDAYVLELRHAKEDPIEEGEA